MTEKDERIIKDAKKNGTPIFVFTAKDKISADMLHAYYHACQLRGCDVNHIDEVRDRWHEFEAWQADNPEKIKLPD